MFFPLLSIVKAPVRPADRQSNGHPAVRNGPEWSPAVTNGAQRAETVANGLQRAETGPQRTKPVAPALSRPCIRPVIDPWNGDRKGVVWGKRVSVRIDIGWCRCIKK